LGESDQILKFVIEDIILNEFVQPQLNLV